MTEAEGSRHVEKKRERHWHCDQTRRIGISKDKPSRHTTWQFVLNTQWHRETWCTSVKFDCMEEFSCVCGCLSARVFSISAQRPVL